MRDGRWEREKEEGGREENWVRLICMRACARKHVIASALCAWGSGAGMCVEAHAR